MKYELTVGTKIIKFEKLKNFKNLAGSENKIRISSWN